jgi:hypothetical protein
MHGIHPLSFSLAGRRCRHVLLAEPVRLVRSPGSGISPRLRVGDSSVRARQASTSIRIALVVSENQHCDPCSACALHR